MCYGLLFEHPLSTGPQNDGYLPQSTDTYSVTPSVHWDDSLEVNAELETPTGILETLRNAFD